MVVTSTPAARASSAWDRPAREIASKNDSANRKVLGMVDSAQAVGEYTVSPLQGDRAAWRLATPLRISMIVPASRREINRSPLLFGDCLIERFNEAGAGVALLDLAECP